MYNVGFIPVRQGSKSIINKNIRDLNSKPLIYWTVMAAQVSNLDKVYVSTDGENIKSVVEQFGFDKVEVIPRSPETVTDTASSESALLEFCQKYEFDNVVFLQATSPLTTAVDINGALEKYLASDKASLISAVKRFQFVWGTDGNPLNYDPVTRPRRQDWSGYYIENGAFYISSRENILKSNCRITPPVEFWEMPEKTLFEVDEPEDFAIIENLFHLD